VNSETAIKLWDWPTRLVHWGLVLLLPSLWWTWKSGQMELHQQLGYVALTLLLFRLFWGFTGASTARFANFVRGPRKVGRYVRGLFSGAAEPVIGHNPLGGWSVLALLGLLITEVALGLFTQDVDGLESGPLTQYVSYETADAARYWHGLIFDLLIWLVAFHLAAILFYLLVKRDNLVGPMISGRKRMAPIANPPSFGSPVKALIGALMAGAVAWWLSRGAPL